MNRIRKYRSLIAVILAITLIAYAKQSLGSSYSSYSGQTEKAYHQPDFIYSSAHSRTSTQERLSNHLIVLKKYLHDSTLSGLSYQILQQRLYFNFLLISSEGNSASLLKLICILRI